MNSYPRAIGSLDLKSLGDDVNEIIFLISDNYLVPPLGAEGA